MSHSLARSASGGGCAARRRLERGRSGCLFLTYYPASSPQQPRRRTRRGYCVRCHWNTKLLMCARSFHGRQILSHLRCQVPSVNSFAHQPFTTGASSRQFRMARLQTAYVAADAVIRPAVFDAARRLGWDLKPSTFQALSAASTQLLTRTRSRVQRPPPRVSRSWTRPRAWCCA